MVRWALGFFLAVTAGATEHTPFPAPNFPYFGQIAIQNPTRQPAQQVDQLKKEAVEGCRTVHRALYAIENYWEEIPEVYGTKGANFPVLYRNRAFYQTRLANRLHACTKGRIKLKLYGRCATERDTVAFVKVTFGFVHSTINLCDEFFDDSSPTRVGTLVHEYGRLEDIGDSPNFDTNNIYVWDRILDGLGNERAFAQLGELKAKKTPTP